MLPTPVTEAIALLPPNLRHRLPRIDLSPRIPDYQSCEAVYDANIGVITLATQGEAYRAAQRGEPLMLAAVLRHELEHHINLAGGERAAHVAELAFMRSLNAPTSVLAWVKESNGHALARESRETTANRRRLGVRAASAEHKSKLNLDFRTTSHYSVFRGLSVGRSHTSYGRLVVPVVMLVGDAVMQASNSDLPELVTLNSIIPSVSAWAGCPVVAGHPMRNGQPISANAPELADTYLGEVVNPRLDGKRLMCEVHLDPDRVPPEMLANINANKPIEVSVGCYVTTRARSGVVGGKRYAREWQSVEPNHLAFVHKGACGTACSTLPSVRAANRKQSEERVRMNMNNPAPDPYAAPLRALAIANGYSVPEPTDDTAALKNMAAFRNEVYRMERTSLHAEQNPARSDVHLVPPNPYSEAALAAHRIGKVLRDGKAV